MSLLTPERADVRRKYAIQKVKLKTLLSFFFNEYCLSLVFYLSFCVFYRCRVDMGPFLEVSVSAAVTYIYIYFSKVGDSARQAVWPTERKTAINSS